jgi:rhodanese-related sulfurtransferase/DNA-binding transcriptional ArsR family regulator
MQKNPGDVKTGFFVQLALIGKALSSAPRIEILDLLCQAERTVEVLAREASITVANASRHLQVLRLAGLVDSRREKNFIHYRISSPDVYRLWKMVQEAGHQQLAGISRAVSDYFDSRDELQVIDHQEIHNRVKSGEIVLLDVRPEEEYREAHIRGATSIPLKELRDRMAQLPKDKTIVAYCRGPFCVMSQEAVKLLRKNRRNAFRISDGVRDWKSQEIEKDCPAKPG